MSTSGVSSTGSSTGLLGQQSLNSSGGLTSGSTLTNSGAGGQPQIVGLASGINTNALIQAELAQYELPLTNIQDTITALNTENSQLSSMQSSLETVSLDALSLGEPSLFFQQQTVSSSDSSLVAASTTQNIGAVVGSTTVAVTALASASQATFSYTAPTASADTLTIGNDQGTQTVAVTAGESNAAIASAINSANSGVAYATVLSNGDLVISSRTTGDGSTNGTGNGNPITLSSSVSGSLTAVSSQAGQDAELYVNGSSTPTYSQTDTVTNAVPGVTLTLGGVTPTNAPVTITTSAPAPDTNSIVQAVQQFVKDYNSAILGVESAVNSPPPSESNSSYASPYTGSLFGDPELENLLGNIRNAMYTSDSTLASGYQSMQDLGISTGASTGSATSSSTSGMLTVNTATLTAAIQANPSAVQADLASWSTQFQQIVNAASGPFGSLQSRISGNGTQITNLNSQLVTAQQMYSNEQANLQEQWAQTEATLSTLKSQGTAFAAFTPVSSSSSSSGG